MMSSHVDELLGELRSRACDRELSGLEEAVSRKIARAQALRAQPGSGLGFQIAVVCVALFLGLAVAEVSGYSAIPQRLNSEIVVLSDDGTLAPSVRLGGGT
jgi:hypothetical protein